jgi:TonB family protein
VPPPDPLASESAVSETGGSAPGTDNRVTSGVAVGPGSGNAGNGNGSAIAVHGRGSGAPGLPASVPALRTNREAKPLQTARASYPAMALRMGLESDVMLKIEVDSDGKVTKAEIIKSGGAGFDEEALKAVKQSRFEPAQRDGQYVAAEFSYIYRFRLQR